MVDSSVIEQYFCYHPPKTVDRKQAHELVNTKAVELYKILISTVKYQKFVDIQNDYTHFISIVTKNKLSQDWAQEALLDAVFYAENMSKDKSSKEGVPIYFEDEYEEILKYVQYFRMSLNQGVTLDEVTT